jgi:DUF1009 family protein
MSSAGTPANAVPLEAGPAAGADPSGPLAIVCGGGSLPAAVAEAAQQSGRRVVMFPVRGWADPASVERFAHHWIALGQVGHFRRLARQEGCRDVVFIGSAVRPPVSAIRLDWLGLSLLPRIAAMFRGGDDHLLTGVARVFEEYGFRLLGAHEVAPDILIPAGRIGRFEPSARDRADIERGLALLAAIGPFDIGQAAVVAGNHVLAVEAAEGTDAMLARIAELRAKGRIPTPPGVGVLVKAPKPGQDLRFDLPAIGPRTVGEVARAGLAGIAVAAGGSIVAEPAEMVAAADKANIFVFGIPGERP